MEWSYEDKIRIECVVDLKEALLKTTNEIIKMHGNDPDMDLILAAAYYSVIMDLGKCIDKKIPEAILLMIGTGITEVQ